MVIQAGLVGFGEGMEKTRQMWLSHVYTCLRVQRLNVSRVKLDSFKFQKIILMPKRAEWKVLKKDARSMKGYCIGTAYGRSTSTMPVATTPQAGPN